MALRMKSMVLMAFAAIAFPLFGASYSYNGLTWYDTVSPGQWTSKYADAKAYAKENNAPLVVVWANPPCGYCRSFESQVGGSGDVKKWMTSSKYVFVFALGTANNASYGLSNGDGSAAKSFAGSGLSKFPYIGVWWPKDKNGREVKQTFSGRSGYMPVTSGSLARQFIDSVDALVGEYASVAPKYVKVTFNANGGSGLSQSSRLVKAGGAVGALPTATKSGCRLSGWTTAKTGGNAVTASTKAMGNVTYYAQWVKQVTLTLKSSPSSGGSTTGGGSYDVNATVSVKAKADSGYVFSWWKNGSTSLSQSPTYSYKLGTANTTLSALFIRSTADNVTLSAKIPSELETGKAIKPIAVSATGGSLPTVKASGLPGGLVFAAESISGTPKKSGLYTIALTATTASGAKADVSAAVTVRAANERIVKATCDASRGKTSGSGIYADGSTATVKAVAANRCVFAGWYRDGLCVSKSASYKLPVDGRDVALTADFVTKAEDAASVELSVAAVRQEADVVQTNTVLQGVALDWPVDASACTETTPAVRGLPSGLKLVKDKTTGKYTITGVPTAVSKADKNGNLKPSSVTLKVKTSGGSTKTYKMAIAVKARPEWTEGVFNGYVGSAKKPAGIVYNLTVAANGKISGKLLCKSDGKGLTYTLSAPALQLSGGEYMATIAGKVGSEAETFAVKFSKDSNGGYSYGVVKAAGEGWTAVQTPWKTNDKLKALAKKIAKAKPLPISGVLGDFGDVTLKFGVNGAVTVKGGGVSNSAVLIPDSEEPASFLLYFYLAPKKLFPGYAGVANLKWDGTNFSL